jgi:hypothetical protein
MESNSFKPFSVAAVTPRRAFQACPAILPTQSNSFACSLFAGGFPFHSEPPRLTQVPESTQRGAIALAIAILDSSPAQFTRLCHERERGAVHKSGPADASCRLCLIACNSSRFDEVWGLVDGAGIEP